MTAMPGSQQQPKPVSDDTKAPLLTIHALSSHYGSIAVLRDINIVIGRDQLVALVGANGAGKSTLLRAISGVQKVTSGRIEFDGEDITRLPADKRVRMGICHAPEGRRVFGPLSVEDNLRLGGYARADKRGIGNDLDRMYAAFPALARKRRLPAGTLSGGQQQMLAIARALMGHPRLLLLDEPSMGVAPLLVEEIFATITELCRRTMAILLVEQNAHAALTVADRGYVIETGKVVLSGSGKELLDNERVREAYLGI